MYNMYIYVFCESTTLCMREDCDYFELVYHYIPLWIIKISKK